MSSGLLSLKWNNHRSTFFHVLSSIRSKESYCDATLACDGRFYPVHKLVLSTCSEYFEQIFERTQCKHPVIVLKDIKFDDLEALMNYMYVGEVNVLQEKLAGLIKAAECLKIKGLAVPDEDPLSNSKRTSVRLEADSPRAKRRRREEAYSYEERERNGSSRSARLSQRDQQIARLENSQLEQSSVDSNIVDNHSQGDDSEPEQQQSSDQKSHRTKHNSESGSQRLSSQKPAPEVSIDETSVKAEPPDIQEEEIVEDKETLHSNLGFGTSGDANSVNADPSSVASGSNEATYSDSNVMDSTPQSVEEVVAQAIPPTSSGFQGNSFSIWEGESSLQNFPGEGFSGENSQGRPMVEVPLNVANAPSKERDGASEASEEALPSHPVQKMAPNSLSQSVSSSSPPPICRSSSASPASLHSSLSHSSPIHSPSTASVPVPSLSHSIQSFLSNSINSYRSKVIMSSDNLYSASSSSSQINYPSSQLSPGRNRTSMPCNICSKVFPTPTALKVHIRTHTGEKPFSCGYCMYRTAQKGNLATHMRTHTGEKPFVCSICLCRFKSGSALTGHMRSKH